MRNIFATTNRAEKKTMSFTKTQKKTTDVASLSQPALVTRLYADQPRIPDINDSLFSVVNDTDEVGRTVLHYLAGGLTNDKGAYYEEGDVSKLLDWLVFMGADPDARDVTGKTALHYLVDRCSEPPGEDPLRLSDRHIILECIGTLLRQGADPNIQDASGLWPVARAAIFGAKDVLAVVVSEGNIDLTIVCEKDGPSAEYTGVHEPIVEDNRWSKFRFRGCTVLDFAAASRETAGTMTLEPSEVPRRSNRSRAQPKKWGYCD